MSPRRVGEMRSPGVTCARRRPSLRDIAPRFLQSSVMACAGDGKLHQHGSAEVSYEVLNYPPIKRWSRAVIDDDHLIIVDIDIPLISSG